jgi:hypothetical protein
MPREGETEAKEKPAKSLIEKQAAKAESATRRGSGYTLRYN